MQYIIAAITAFIISMALWGLILWCLWGIGWLIMWAFPFTAAFTVGTLAVAAFIAWRRSRG